MTADIAVNDGRIVEVGRDNGAAHERIDAAGVWLTPGCVKARLAALLRAGR
jgi:N-acyl-D-aspartate/D-glutamate deacylase